jgi:hypothetical protein
MIHMSADSTQAKKILDIIRGAGERGITRGEISRAITAKGCDCENWINTLLEAGEIEKCGKRASDSADLYRIAK